MDLPINDPRYIAAIRQNLKNQQAEIAAMEAKLPDPAMAELLVRLSEALTEDEALAIADEAGKKFGSEWQPVLLATWRVLH